MKAVEVMKIKKNVMLHETLSNGRDIDIEDIDIEIKEDRKSDIRKKFI